jgi:hypothetical protein
MALAFFQNHDDALLNCQICLRNAALHDYRVMLNLLMNNSELRWWVKPRSTT